MLKIFHKKFGDSYKTITFVADIRIFSCLFVKFVLYTSGVPWGGSSAFLFIICLSSQGSPGKPCVRKWSGIDATEPEKEIPDI